MADYIYTMETRLTPEQYRGLNLVQEIARAHELNVYLTGGAVRDLISGLPIRDLDFSVQGNPLKLLREFERAGISVQGTDDDFKVVYALLPGNVRAEIGMTRSESYVKPGKPPVIAPATINEDLRRRDFTVNAMALSLNPGSRGLLLDPLNGAADIESKLIRILHNYSFYEEPSRLLRAIHYSARFHWPLEERTQTRYNSAKENNYVEHISQRTVGLEIEQLAHEDQPLHIMQALEREGWLQVLNPHWSEGKADKEGLGKLTKLRQQMYELGYTPDTAASVLYFLTRRLPPKDVADIRKIIPRRDLVENWKRLETDAAQLARRLAGKEAATPSRTWHLLSNSKPETILFTAISIRQQSVSQKIDHFFGKWRQVKQKLPLPEMVELNITPLLPDYQKVAEEAFLLLLDGKLRSRNETLKFLKPYAPPPPPPPPPPPKRGRLAKEGTGGATAAAPATGKKRGRRPKSALLPPAEAGVAKVSGREAPPAMPAPAEKSQRPIEVAKLASVSTSSKIAAPPAVSVPSPKKAPEADNTPAIKREHGKHPPAEALRKKKEHKEKNKKEAKKKKEKKHKHNPSGKSKNKNKKKKKR